jgi:hypothetical protein
MQINNYYGLSDWRKKPNKTIKQKTAAMSYYILKYLLFDYFLSNEFAELSNYSQLLNKILDIGFKTKEFNNIMSSRMTLLQLK